MVKIHHKKKKKTTNQKMGKICPKKLVLQNHCIFRHFIFISYFGKNFPSNKKVGSKVKPLQIH